MPKINLTIDLDETEIKINSCVGCRFNSEWLSCILASELTEWGKIEPRGFESFPEEDIEEWCPLKNVVLD
jgi:hypothetical protein